VILIPITVNAIIPGRKPSRHPIRYVIYGIRIIPIYRLTISQGSSPISLAIKENIKSFSGRSFLSAVTFGYRSSTRFTIPAPLFFPIAYGMVIIIAVPHRLSRIAAGKENIIPFAANRIPLKITMLRLLNANKTSIVIAARNKLSGVKRRIPSTEISSLQKMKIKIIDSQTRSNTHFLSCRKELLFLFGMVRRFLLVSLDRTAFSPMTPEYMLEIRVVYQGFSIFQVYV